MTLYDKYNVSYIIPFHEISFIILVTVEKK